MIQLEMPLEPLSNHSCRKKANLKQHFTILRHGGKNLVKNLGENLHQIFSSTATIAIFDIQYRFVY